VFDVDDIKAVLAQVSLRSIVQGGCDHSRRLGCWQNYTRQAARARSWLGVLSVRRFGRTTASRGRANGRVGADTAGAPSQDYEEK